LEKEEKAMAIIREDFDSYKIWYYSGFSYEALIYVYRARKYVGRIVFFKDENQIPPNASYPEPSIHYPIRKFDDVVSILREEKPLYLFLSTNKIGIIATADFEPVGEEEGG
jgi:hypothetical protein